MDEYSERTVKSRDITFDYVVDGNTKKITKLLGLWLLPNAKANMLIAVDGSTLVANIPVFASSDGFYKCYEKSELQTNAKFADYFKKLKQTMIDEVARLLPPAVGGKPKRVIHTGKFGGKYYISMGQKIYLK